MTENGGDGRYAIVSVQENCPWPEMDAGVKDASVPLRTGYRVSGFELGTPGINHINVIVIYLLYYLPVPQSDHIIAVTCPSLSDLHNDIKVKAETSANQ